MVSHTVWTVTWQWIPSTKEIVGLFAQSRTFALPFALDRHLMSSSSSSSSSHKGQEEGHSRATRDEEEDEEDEDQSPTSIFSSSAVFPRAYYRSTQQQQSRSQEEEESLPSTNNNETINGSRTTNRNQLHELRVIIERVLAMFADDSREMEGTSDDANVLHEDEQQTPQDPTRRRQ